MQTTFRLNKSNSRAPETTENNLQALQRSPTNTLLSTSTQEDDDSDQFIWEAFDQATSGTFETHSMIPSPADPKYPFGSLGQLTRQITTSSADSEPMNSLHDPTFSHIDTNYDQLGLASPSSDLISPFQSFTVSSDHASCCGNLGTEDCPRISTVKKQRRREQNRKAQQNYAARKQATLEQLKFIVKSQATEITRLQDLNKLLMKQLIDHPTYEGGTPTTSPILSKISDSTREEDITKINTNTTTNTSSNRRGKEKSQPASSLSSENRRWSIVGPGTASQSKSGKP